MSASRADGHVFEETTFEGDISINGETAPIKFDVSAGSDCRLRIDADDVDGRTYFLAVRNQGTPGESQEEFILNGTSADDKAIFSERVSIGGHGHKDDGRWISLRPRVCKITVPLERHVENPTLRRWFRSFRSFRNPPIETRFGKLNLWGATENVGPDALSGGVSLEAPSGDPGDTWREEADNFLRHMHRGLGLAHGGRLQNPLIEYSHGLTWERTFFDGAGFTPELPVQYHLNHGPFTQALVNRYEAEGSLPDILWMRLTGCRPILASMKRGFCRG
jgi:hypothetical protein